MSSQAPLLTFVTPFYNTEAYLAECMESVLRQGYGNWEYVLLNNCSTDRSVEIAEGYARREPGRIRLEHNPEFLSQLQNYNRALRLLSPKSEYCKFIQADDWLFPDCARSMVELAEAHPDVGIVAAYELEGEDVRLDGIPVSTPVVAGREACRLFFLRGRYLFGTPTSLLLRSSIIRSRSPFYEERYWPFEDGHVCFDLLKTWNFGFVHQVLTYTRRENASIISPFREFGLERFLHFSMLFAHGRDFLSVEEYGRLYKRVAREYFLYLARNACKFESRGDEFWKFHRQGLGSVGLTLNWRLMAKWMPRGLLEKTWESFWAWLDRDHLQKNNQPV